MRSDRLAEAILSIVAPPDRAAAAVGDLLELVPDRGRLWFWASVLRTAGAIVWGHFRAQPLRLTFYAALASFGYALLALLLLVAIHMILLMLSLSGEVLAVRTGVTRLGELLALGGEPVVAETVNVFVMLVAAPYLAGRRVADVYEERAIALTMALIVIWSLMLALVPLRYGDSARVPMLVSIIPFMLAGAARQRLIAVRRSHPPIAG
jgi:hypothetical protein